MNKIFNFNFKNNLKEIYKKVFKTFYPNKDEKKIDEYVDMIFKRDYKDDLKLSLRNLYENSMFELKIEEFFDKYIKDKMSLSSIGTLFFSVEKKSSILKDLITKLLTLRKHYKKLMLESKSKGDSVNASKYDLRQNKYKTNANSIFGVATSISILTNPDFGASVSNQGKMMTAAVLWSIESFLSRNIIFYNFDDLISFVMNIKEYSKKIDMTEDYEYLYKPSVEECLEIFNKHKEETSLYRYETDNYDDIVNNIITGMNEKERIIFYFLGDYKNFIIKHDKVKELLKSLISNDCSFLNPDDIIPYKCPEEEKAKYIKFEEDIKYLSSLLIKYTHMDVSVYKRLEKYIECSRKSIILSDTDSVMISLEDFVDFVQEKIFSYDINDEKTQFKTINLMTYIVSKVSENTCKFFREMTTEDRDSELLLIYKNEYYYSRMIIMTTTKKRYAARMRLQEGKIIPDGLQLDIKGDIIVSSKNKIVTQSIKEIIFNDILCDSNISVFKILSNINKIRVFLKDEIMSGKKEYGILTDYKKNMDKYLRPESDIHVKLALLWNFLEDKPEFKINPGNKMYKFRTNLVTIDDVKKMKDEVMRDKILDVLYDINGTYKDDKSSERECLRKFIDKSGLEYFAILDNDLMSIPDWLIEHIDISYMQSMHLNPLINVLPSLNISTATNSSTSTNKLPTNIMNRLFN